MVVRSDFKNACLAYLNSEVHDAVRKQQDDVVTHDGGPDRCDGAPSDGDLED